MPGELPGPQLGYWLKTKWPAYGGGERYDNVLLLNPLLENSQLWVPIQVSFYENLNQEAFWAVGVRKYGTELLKT